MASSFCVQEPFTTNDYADVILRSCDGFDFYVAKVILIMVSPIFKDMFSLPQPSPSTEQAEAPHLPVIDITESGIVIDTLLRCIYGPADEAVPSVEPLFGVLLAAEKYEMHRVLKWAKKTIRTLCSDSDDESVLLQAFAFACNHHLEDEARSAARKSLGYPIFGEPFAHCLDAASGRASINLFEYHDEVGKRVVKLFSNASEMPIPIANLVSCCGCSRTKCAHHNELKENLWLPEWWTNMCNDISNAGRIYNGISGPLSTSGFSMEFFMHQFISVPRCEHCCKRVFCKGAAPLYNLLRLEMEKIASQVAFKLPWEDAQWSST